MTHPEAKATQEIPWQYMTGGAAYLWLLGFAVAVFLGSTREAFWSYLAYVGLAAIAGFLSIRVGKWVGVALVGILFVYPFFGFFFGPFVLVPIALLLGSLVTLPPARRRPD